MEKSLNRRAWREGNRHTLGTPPTNLPPTSEPSAMLRLHQTLHTSDIGVPPVHGLHSLHSLHSSDLDHEADENHHRTCRRLAPAFCVNYGTPLERQGTRSVWPRVEW